VIEPSKAFKSEYLSLRLSLSVSAAGRLFFAIEWNQIIPRSQPSRFFNRPKVLERCGETTSEIIVTHTKNGKLSQEVPEAGLSGDHLRVIRNSTALVQLSKLSPVIIERWLEDRTYSFEGVIRTAVTNRVGASKEVRMLYLMPSFTLPRFAGIQLLSQDGKPQSLQEATFHVYSASPATLGLVVTLNAAPNSTMLIRFPFQKKLLSFENYPHDPYRGLDLAGGLVFYQHGGEWRREALENSLVIIPQPDLSMPFLIITSTMTIYTYLFLNVFSIFLKKL
jgi:hypothetical protein